MNYVAGDVRHGLRLIKQSPGFSALAVAALALGMGATTAIFSVVDAVLWKPLPFRDPGRLLAMWEKNPAQNKFRLFVAPANFWEWRKQSQTLEGVAAIRDQRLNLTGGPNGRIDPEELRAERVSVDLFPLLGVQAVVGRTFRPEEDRPGGSNFAILSHALWERRFGSDPGIAGKNIVLGGQSDTVVGVLPAGFSVLDPAVDVWLPLGLAPSDTREAMSRTLMGIGRLKPGVALEQAQAELETIGTRLEHDNPALNAGWRPSLLWLREELVGKVERALLVLMAAVGFLLLMACTNVANLLLARGASRRREIAVRAAMGATRGRVIAQLLSESLLLALAGGLLGLALARVGVAALARLAAQSVPRMGEARVDVRLFLFALGASMLCGILFGIAPALHLARTDLNPALREGGRSGTTGRTGRRIRSVLVIAEVALAVMILIGAGLLIRSFVRLRSADPGFQAEGVITLRLPLAGGRNAQPERRVAFIQQIEDRLAALPGARGVGAGSALPLSGLGIGDMFAVAGRPLPPLNQRPIGLIRSVTAGYFRTIGIRLIEGREFTAADTATSPPVTVISQTAARRLWQGGDPLGGRLIWRSGRSAEVVGVVADVKAERVDGEDWPTAYMVYPQAPLPTMTIVLRTAEPPSTLGSAVVRVVHELDPEQPVADVRDLESVVTDALAGSRFNAVLLSVFAAVAFVLAAVGIYGVMAYEVSERSHEMGIRMALGAQPGDVLRLVLVQAGRLTVTGIALGLGGAFGLTRLMSTLLYGVKPADAFTFAAIALLLAVVAMVASLAPSRRAMALDPMATLHRD